ncbi:MAG: cation transporter [Treponemataceae bacterium]|nr:cation transporter [Treponemataceae bacterium]
MTRTLKVDGMMCAHCEAHVKKALEAVGGVAAATADHTSGTATVTLTGTVADDALAKAVADAGYTLIG